MWISQTVYRVMYASLSPRHQARASGRALVIDILPTGSRFQSVPGLQRLPVAETRGLVGLYLPGPFGPDHIVVKSRAVRGTPTWRPVGVVAHEIGHAFARNALSSYEWRRVGELYRARLKTGKFPTPYAATDVGEYFAESVAAFFDAGHSPDRSAHVNSAWLARNDPAMARLLSQIFSRRGPHLRTRPYQWTKALAAAGKGQRSALLERL